MNPDVQKLTCEKGCGKCCDVGGTDKILLATAEEAKAIGHSIGIIPAGMSTGDDAGIPHDATVFFI